MTSSSPHWSRVEINPAASTSEPATGEIAETFNRVTKYVATHSPETLTWRNSMALGDDVAAAVGRLKENAGRKLLVQGSSALVQTLLTADLIDEFRLLIYPIVLGRGKRLLGEGAIPAAFRLTRSAASPSGVLIADYERSGDVETGSFALENPS